MILKLLGSNMLDRHKHAATVGVLSRGSNISIWSEHNSIFTGIFTNFATILLPKNGEIILE